MMRARTLVAPAVLLGGTSLSLLFGGAASAVPTSPAQPAQVAPAAVATVSYYTVVAGDTVTSIAATHGLSPTTLAAINALPDADFIVVGQQLRLNETVPVPAGAPAPPASAPAEAPVTTASTHSTSSHSFGSTASSEVSSSSPRSGFESCVVSRESGGNPNARNGQYWGLYQFSYQTWVGNGGNPGDYGHASSGEQQQVFERSAPSNWAPYDGC